MRVFFAILALSLTVLCHGATPSYSSFDQVYFTTNNRVVSLRTNLISTNSITTLYVTNLYTSNFFTTNITVNNITVTTNITVAGTNVPTINPTDLYIPYRTGTNSFGDSPLHVQSAGSTNTIIDGQLIWGPGTTNVLYRSESSLVVTNGATTNAFTIRNGLGTGFHMTYNPGGNPRLDSDNGFIWFGDTTVFEGNLIPDSGNTRSLGTMASNGSFADSVFFGSHYLLGSNDSGANYSRLKIDHNNSNVLFDSQSLGTGTARDFLFQSNGVTIAKIALNSGYTGAGSLFLSDNGTYQSSGATTINPSDNYLPVRTSATAFGDSPLHIPSAGSDNVILDGTLTMGAGTAPTEVPITLNVPSGHTNWLARLNNGGTNWLHIDHQGRIGIGVTNVFINKDIGIYRAFDSDGNKPAWINIGAGNSWPFNYASEWWAKTSTNDGVMQLSWLTNGSSVTRDHVFSVGSSDGLFYYQTKSNNVTTFEVSGGSGNIYTLGSITFGPGTTNVLSRDGTSLRYSLGGTNDISFNVTNGVGMVEFGPGNTNVVYKDGLNLIYEGAPVVGNTVSVGARRGSSTAYFGVNSAGGAFVQSAANRAILDVGGIQAFWDGTNFQPADANKNLGTAASPWLSLYVAAGGGSGVFIRAGTGTPEGAVTANVGSLWLRTDGGAGTTLYVKESGTGNTGWIGK